ncbi:MAG: DNA polymerase I [Nitrospirota bacterium]
MTDGAQADGPHPAPATLYLIDGHSLLYRAYYAIPRLSTASGQPTNAVYGMATMLLKVVRERKPDYLAIAFDTKAPTHRHRAYEAYKSHRPPMPDALSAQLPLLDRLIDALRMPKLALEGYEADDLIATAAIRAAARGLTVVIVSSDKDLYQLVGGAVSLYDAMKDLSIGPDQVAERFGIAPAQIPDLLGLMGDSIDNVPGVPGVGEKTASALIRQFGSIDQLLARLGDVERPKLRESLRAHAEQARMSRELARLHSDCPVEIALEAFKFSPPDVEALRRLFADLEFTTLLKGLPAGQAGLPAAGVLEAPAAALPPVRTDLESLWAALPSAQVVALSLHVGPHPDQPPAGLCASIDDGGAYYLPWGNAVRELCDRAREAARPIAAHGAKSIVHALGDLGIEPPAMAFDTWLAAYLLDPTRARYDVDQLALAYGLEPPPAAASLEERPEGCGALSRTVRRLIPPMRRAINEQGLEPLLDEVELPLIEVLTAMERRGILLDTDQLQEVRVELRGHLDRLEERIYQLAGARFNLNSPKQLADILFEKLGLPPVRKTKTGYSTDEAVLTQLALQHELPAELINHRQLSKLLSTYVEALPALINPRTGRIHTTFHQTVAATGRLSSSNPNLQNIPIRGEWGLRIRRCFIAPPGHALLSADYNQIELRLMAHLSQDPMLLEAFQRDDDVHAATAAQLFGLPREQITGPMRRVAKTINFAVIYGMSPFGLSKELGIAQLEARRYIERYFDYYRGVKEFIAATIARAAQDGYVATLWRRRRPIPELAQRAAAVRALGERTAVNTVVQGSAADLIKVAMNRVHRRLRREGRESALLLQIHDELVLEAPDGELAAVSALVVQEMEGVASLSVPLRVDLGTGRHWAETQ